MLFRVGPGSSGYNFQPEYVDHDCVFSIPASGSLAQGQVLCYDATNVPSTAGADKVVLPTSANAGRLYGVYQGPTIVNPSGSAALLQTVLARKIGYGVVLMQVTASGTGSTAITVGATAIIGANGTALPDAYVGAAAANVTVGVVQATGTHTAYGSTILAGASVATVVANVYISV